MGNWEAGNFEKDDYRVNLDIQLNQTVLGIGERICLIIERNMHGDTPRRFFLRHYASKRDATLIYLNLLDFFKHFYKAGYKIVYDPDKYSEHIPWEFKYEDPPQEIKECVSTKEAEG